ncbi:MAG: hypothetical protein FWE34_01855 [Defluviitaleaceae bacterium]|nr:hypothetical protein [Defluviitaleaceae bacterium]
MISEQNRGLMTKEQKAIDEVMQLFSHSKKREFSEDDIVKAVNSDRVDVINAISRLIEGKVISLNTNGLYESVILEVR